MKINLAFLTGARSEYGIAKPLLKEIESDPNFNLMIFPNGMHLLKEFGYTVNEIWEDGFETTELIQTYNSIKGKSHQFSNSVSCIYDVLKKYTIDIVYIIGDRIEAYTSALAAHFLNIPIAHFGGGTITIGAVDNIYRYNITNLSDVHFATSKNNYQRLLECTLTENKNVHFTGSSAIDGIMEYKAKNSPTVKGEKEKYRYALMTFHPVTASSEPIPNLMDSAIDNILKNDCSLVLTYPNNDVGCEDIIEVINKWKSHEKIDVNINLGAEAYYRTIENSLFLIGNSSSGITEAPYFNKPVINVGSRQDGRDKDVGVNDVSPTASNVAKTLENGFQKGWVEVKCTQMYGDGNAAYKILKLLKTVNSPIKYKK